MSRSIAMILFWGVLIAFIIYAVVTHLGGTICDSAPDAQGCSKPTPSVMTTR